MVRPIATACLLAGVTLLLYGFRLGATPLSPEEANVISQAQHLSGTQLFFHIGGDKWLQPVGVYATAIAHEAGARLLSGRVVSVIVGALNVALLFAAARMLWQRDSIAIATAVILMLTPAHQAMAQLGTDAILPVPFVLLWLIGVLRFLRSDSALALAAAGAALGAGLYSHQTAPLTMAGLAIATAVSLVAARRRMRAMAAFVAAFAALLIPAAIWFTVYPATYPDTFGRWAVLKAHLRFPMEALRAQANWNTVSNRSSLFWGFLDPSFLFFAPRDGRIAPLLVCSALLVPLGIQRVVTAADLPTRILLPAAALIPAMVASTFGEAQALANVTAMIAAAALIAGAGVASLGTRKRAWTWIAAAAAIASAAQVAMRY